MINQMLQVVRIVNLQEQKVIAIQLSIKKIPFSLGRVSGKARASGKFIGKFLFTTVDEAVNLSVELILK